MLEVVRGRDVGKRFVVPQGEVVLGNAAGSTFDLGGQEPEQSPRRMAARHASLQAENGTLSILDLESPGGTFVNRQRILNGQSRPLQDGDVIQLGPLQLKVVKDGSGASAKTPVASPLAPPPPPSQTRSSLFSYSIPGGPTCRSWDELLTASAQRWNELREELVSGRLTSYLESIGRGELAPRRDASGTADDRLDDWLGRLPVVKPANPELDVHPSRLVVKATPGGGTLQRTIQVSNVGLRLLRSRIKVEPGAPWLKLDPTFNGTSFATVESTEVVLEVEVPERLPTPLKATLLVESNGGSKRVEVILEARTAATDVAPPDSSEPSPTVGPTLADWVRKQPPVARLVTWSFAAVLIRLLVGVASGSIGEDAMVASGPEVPRLAGVAVLFAALGAGLCGWLAWRRGGPRDGLFGAFAGGVVGVMYAAAIVAACRSFEPLLGSLGGSIVAVSLLWAALGALKAWLSILWLKETPSP